ncbi:MAG: ferrochelatase [Flavobacteriales bacterium]|nr:ferrochelatase [Flavobacteriales bacterium]
MKGVLLVNLGSPKSTKVKDVRTYLRQFLMDERVIDKPYLLRKFIVECFILPTRPKKSAEAYSSIWWKEGSPLVVISKKQQEKLQQKVDIPVGLAMRYAEPSIEFGIQELVDKGVDDVLMIPLYPQYAMSSYETVVVEAERIQKKKFPNIKITNFPVFYNNSDYIEVFSNHIKKQLPSEYDAILFSYHGIPERHIYKTDDFGQCKIGGCCQRKDSPSHAKCYRHQCFEVTRLVTEKLNLDKEKVHQSFQSRLLKDPWLKPYTDKTLEDFPQKGIKKLVVITPAFITDCLETLEEIKIEGKEEFLSVGGEEFTYIPCLNDAQEWIDVLQKWTNEFQNADVE